MVTHPLVPLETSDEGCSDRVLGVVAYFQAFLEYPDTLSTFLTWLISWGWVASFEQMLLLRWTTVYVVMDGCCCIASTDRCHKLLYPCDDRAV